MAKVKLIDVSKVYKGNVRAVSDFNLEIEDGEFIIFVGPSGCGKSTTLRMIAGLEEITSGKIYIGDTLVNNIEPKDRDIAMVFQNYALYPHMSVFDNLGYSLKCHHEKKEVIKEKVEKVAKLLNIQELLNRKPRELSGGQRQRVALGRCLIRQPKAFLFDEPLSNLDAKLRVQMRSEISKLHKQVQGTFIYVTHDQTEAMTMGDRIVVMKDGFVQQIDTPVNLYEHPVNIFVATFLGSPQMNIFKVKLNKDKLYFSDDIYLKLSEKTKNKMIDGYDGKTLSLGIRPSDFDIANESDYDFCIEKIDLVEKLGNETLLYLTLPGREESTIVSLKLDMADDLKGPLYLKVNKDKIHLFNEDDESILKINDYNFVPSKLSLENDILHIDSKYQIDNFSNKCIFSEIKQFDNGYIRIASDAFKTKKTNKDDYVIEVEVCAKDIRSKSNVYFAKKIKDNIRITFICPKDEHYELGDKVKLYVPINEISICDSDKNVLMVDENIVKPIIDANIEMYGKEYYLVTQDKQFSKNNKYLLVEKIYDLNSKMLLRVINQKNETLTLKINKNNDFFNGLMIYTKYKKVKNR